MDDAMKDFKAIAVDRWGKDHWSLLAYVETLCVDGKEGMGTIDRRRVRCNSGRRPMQGVFGLGWKAAHGTRLDGFFDRAKSEGADACSAAGLQLAEHDDWDCLEDMETAGYVEILSAANGFVRLTPEGIRVGAKLRAHKAMGGMFANYKEPASAMEPA